MKEPLGISAKESIELLDEAIVLLKVWKTLYPVIDTYNRPKELQDRTIELIAKVEKRNG